MGVRPRRAAHTDRPGAVMADTFDTGYTTNPWKALAADPPGAEVYPIDAFRVEWGPIFHRGRLDGSARVLIVGQDPATHEAVCRRILVGEAGQRIQGFLDKLGVSRSYLMINTFLYSVYGQGGGERHIDDAGIAAYRNKWLDAAATRNPLDAIVPLGHLAATAVAAWKAASPAGAASGVPVVPVLHPTFPDSASRSRRPGHPTKAEAMARLCADWNAALTALRPVVTPDAPVRFVPYGTTITEAEHGEIPAFDLPAGLPAWMRSPRAWAARTGADANQKRATITVTVPRTDRAWPPV
jgi:uracil-DNA glycosylase